MYLNCGDCYCRFSWHAGSTVSQVQKVTGITWSLYKSCTIFILIVAHWAWARHEVGAQWWLKIWPQIDAFLIQKSSISSIFVFQGLDNGGWASIWAWVSIWMNTVLQSEGWQLQTNQTVVRIWHYPWGHQNGKWIPFYIANPDWRTILLYVGNSALLPLNRFNLVRAVWIRPASQCNLSTLKSHYWDVFGSPRLQVGTFWCTQTLLVQSHCNWPPHICVILFWSWVFHYTASLYKVLSSSYKGPNPCMMCPKSSLKHIYPC